MEVAPYLSVPKRIFRRFSVLPSGAINIGVAVSANNCRIDLPDMHLCHGSSPLRNPKAPTAAEAFRFRIG
jgi:hypothetical protein